MTEKPETPEAGIAQAVGDLSEQTRNLVREEVGVAQREMQDKAVQAAPAFGLAAAAGALGLLAVASSYRLSLRLLEKRLSPATASLVATLGYGAAAAGTAVLAADRIRRLPPLFPAESARQASQAMAEVTAEVADQAGR